MNPNDSSTGSPALTKPTRGAGFNPSNRFEQIHLEPNLDFDPSEEKALPTIFLRDHSTSIITYNDSPDVPFSASLNPYRGCEHGCIYCYARPTHEFLGFSAGLDFESRIMVKEDAPNLLRKELSARKWKPQVLAMSGVTDPYQPVERKLELTRRCLAVLAECRNPVGIVTKNLLVTRDLDYLTELSRHNCARVFISLTTLDTELRHVLEPRTSPPAARLETIRKLSAAGIPTGVLIAPVIPAMNDHEIPALLKADAAAGAQTASYVILRLPLAVAPLFQEWLKRHFPDRQEKVLNQIRSLREGELNDPNFGSRMHGLGAFAERIKQLFEVSARRAGLDKPWPEMSVAGFRRPAENQLALDL